MKQAIKSTGLPHSNSAGLAAGRNEGEAVPQASIENAAIEDEGNPRKGRDASGTDMGMSRRKALVSGGGALVAAAMLKKFDAAAAEPGGNTSPNHTNGGRETGMITVKDGAVIAFKDWRHLFVRWCQTSSLWPAPLVEVEEVLFRRVAQWSHFSFLAYLTLSCQEVESCRER
jgi:hypothetical protein